MDTEAKIIAYSSNYILIAILDHNGEREWLAIGIYGWPNNADKHKTWRLMKEIRDYLEKPLIFLWGL